MYEKYYNLKENPFTIEPDPKYLYLSPKHENALAYLRYEDEGPAEERQASVLA